MKKIFYSILPVITISLLWLQNFSEPLPLGSALPGADKKMKDISGQQISFNEAMKKNGLLIMFSCNTCPVVGSYQSRTLEIGKFAVSNEIGIILLNSNEAARGRGESFEDMKQYGKEQGYSFNYVVDQDSWMADAFGATRTPEVFLFDKTGKLVYHGAIDDNANGPDQVSRKHAKIAIDEMVSGKKISTSKTRFVGCTIKRK
ncbi:MAG: redoxin domain-containing protein [Chitinophagaceae bacterium]